MAATAKGQPPSGVGRLAVSYADSLRQQKAQVKPVQMKPISYLHGEPQVIWEQEEVNQMIVNENLEYAVIGKFSYGWPDIQELRKLIPKQCELKEECNIGLIRNRYVLIRATILEDYDPMFNPEEEISTTIAWISFSSLPPILFGKEAVFSLAIAVRKPLQVDMVTRNQTRPSCARVKVEVDLLKEFPKRHNAEQCYVEHPELYPEEEKGREEDKKKAWKNSRREVDDKNGDRPTEKKEEEFVEQEYNKWGGGRNKQPK
ncbi:hypothetical protein KY289_013480 [Solanum tuberosum]|nr:hypothetical protein KY289_013480 [Solanum tuberosum]